MRSCVAFFSGKPVGRLIAVSLAALLASACSSDALRFSDNPFSNPFATSDRVDPGATGSITRKKVAKAVPGDVSAPAVPNPVAAVTPSGPLPPPSVPMIGTQSPSILPSRPSAGGLAGSATGWTATGGTAIAVAPGDTVESLSDRYGVPAAALRKANRLEPGGQVPAGHSMIIPVRAAASKVTEKPVKDAAAKSATPAPRPPEPVKSAAVKTDTKGLDRSLARVEEKLKPRAKATDEDEEKPSKKKPGTPPVKPEPKKVAAPVKAKPVRTADDEDEDEAPKPAKKLAAKKPVDTKPVEKPGAKKVAALQPPKAKPVKTDETLAETPKPKAPPPTRSVRRDDELPTDRPAAADETDPTPTGTVTKPDTANGKFRWPAKGRVITGYGSGGNEGINISVPEGTAVRAAEDGVVAYAGDELKRYGKLVLIRHSDGWVTAYAHNGELNVRKGEKVKRGQPVATAGQTGNVSSPQIHFELRKGATPVDPMKHLEGQ